MYGITKVTRLFNGEEHLSGKVDQPCYKNHGTAVRECRREAIGIFETVLRDANYKETKFYCADNTIYIRFKDPKSNITTMIIYDLDPDNIVTSLIEEDPYDDVH